jgi:hypothetical protein
MYLYILLFILLILIFFFYKKNVEFFSQIESSIHDDHQDIIMNDSSKNDSLFASRDILLDNVIPTYAVYQPENSGRHLNFFSHAPKDVPYYPDTIYSSTIQDPYFQPSYKNYFYQNNYFYPLY